MVDPKLRLEEIAGRKKTFKLVAPNEIESLMSIVKEIESVIGQILPLLDDFRLNRETRYNPFSKIIIDYDKLQKINLTKLIRSTNSLVDIMRMMGDIYRSLEFMIKLKPMLGTEVSMTDHYGNSFEDLIKSVLSSIELLKYVDKNINIREINIKLSQLLIKFYSLNDKRKILRFEE